MSSQTSASTITPTGPVPANLALNKKASESSSLFQIAAQIKDRLEDVPGISPFLEMCIGNYPSGTSPNSFINGHSPSSSTDRSSTADTLTNQTIISTASTLSLTSSAVIPPGKKIDPVTHLWQFFRLGSSLCALFNALQPKTPLNVVITNDVKTCKRSVYDFVQGCKSELDYSDDELFTISNVFSDNTTDLLKVIRTVKLLLDTLEDRHLITPFKSKKSSIYSLPVPKDKRDKTVEELLLTERKYVQDLELLHTYQCKLQSSGLLSADTIHYLFPNLNILIDFQRRFLIGIEYHAQLPPEEQRIGSVFLNFRDGFEVYEGFALNQKKASEIAANEAPKLMALRDILEPHYELPCFLIKPIQRICKYPLLLQQLIRYTPKDAPNYQDQTDALDAIRQVTLNVNETQRRVENLSVVRELSERLVDWKGHNLNDFGLLLHDGVFPVIKNGTEREYHLYLFENIILCCKEASPSKKSMTLSSKKSKTKRASVLILKGRIYIAYITDVSKYDASGYFLHIAWGRDDASDTGFFDIRFRNGEQLEQWHSTIEMMVARYNEASNESLEVSAAAIAHAAAASSSLNGDGYGGHYNGNNIINGTSLDEASDDELYMTGPSMTGPSPGTNVLSMINSTAAQMQNGFHYDGFKNDYQSTVSDDISTLRINNSNGNRQLHSIASRQDSAPSLSTLHSQNYQVPRSRSASVPVIQGPGSYMGSSVMNNTSTGRIHPHSMHPGAIHNINHGHISDMYSGGFNGGITMPTAINGGVESNSATTSATNSMTDLSETSMSSSASPSQRLLKQQASRGNLVSEHNNANGYNNPLSATLGALNGYNRPNNNGNMNGSTGNLLSQAGSHEEEWPQGSNGSSNGSSFNGSLSNDSTSSTGTSTNGTMTPGAITASNSIAVGNGTLASALASALSSAAALNAGNSGKPQPEPKMKVKLHYLDDTFVLIVPFNVTYGQLIERVERKIRLCGKQTPNPLRIKYKDEDDDFVTMRSDEDIQMAIEPKLAELGSEYIVQIQNMIKQSGGSQVPSLLGNKKIDLLTVWAA